MLFKHWTVIKIQTNVNSVDAHRHEQTNDEAHGTGEYVSIREKNGEPSWESGRGEFHTCAAF